MIFKHLKPKMEEFLKKVPKGRERSKKDKAIGYVVQSLHTSLQAVPLDKLEPIVTEILALDRYWRLILAEQPELRGSDYEDKVKYEKKAQEALGYISPEEKRVSMEDEIAWFNQMP